MPFSNYFLDKFIAPGVSEFTEAEIPDMSNHDPQTKVWLANYVLNSGLRGNFTSPGNAYAFNYLRRSTAAFTEHDQARQATLAFLANRESVSNYAAAVLHWEFFAGQAWHGLMLLRGFLKFQTNEDVPLPFEQGTDSVQERVNLLYNSMKHAESRIERGQILEGATTPVWLTNEGIQSTDAMLTYADTAETLRDIAEWAGFLVDPIEMKNKIRKHVEGDLDRQEVADTTA